MSRRSKYFDQQLADEALKQMKKFKDHRTQMRLLAIVKASELSIGEVSSFLSVSRNTVARWIKNFRDHGVEGLIDRPRGHNPSKLNNKHKSQISQWLTTQKNSDGEHVYWTLKKIQFEIKKEFGVSISQTPLWHHLRNMGFVMKVPRPVHAKADPEAQETFKKNH